MIKLTDEEFIVLVNHVKKEYGIDLSKKRALIEGRLYNTMIEKKLSSFSQYMNLLFKDKTGNEAINLINRLSTNHTFFMREPQHFEFIQNSILPFWEENNKIRNINIWSAGCSSGEEAYSIAMTLDDYFGYNKELWNIKIIATDISTNSLEKAKRGIYIESNVSNVPELWKKKYFIDNKDGTFKICDKIRKSVIFKPFNLMNDFSYQHFDLIFCRNVMIYFDLKTREELINKFYNATKKDSFLFVGHAEVINRSSTKYKYVKPAIYKR